MSKFKKKREKDAPGITTASLPDIVFMLLFFFMVVTKIRSTESMVKTQLPSATELQKLEKKSLVSHIHIGPPTPKFEKQYGSAPKIQLGDRYAEPEDIEAFIAKEKQKVFAKLQSKMTAALHVDKIVKMGIVTDVKTELRKINFRKVSYLSGERAEDL